MLPYCSAHDEWLIMKLCMYVGYHDANNVHILVVTQFNLKKRLKNLICHFVFQNMRSAGYHEKMIGRIYFGGDQATQLNLVLYNTIKWPYQPKHSPSLIAHLSLIVLIRMATWYIDIMSYDYHHRTYYFWTLSIVWLWECNCTCMSCMMYMPHMQISCT